MQRQELWREVLSLFNNSNKQVHIYEGMGNCRNSVKMSLLWEIKMPPYGNGLLYGGSLMPEEVKGFVYVPYSCKNLFQKIALLRSL